MTVRAIHMMLDAISLALFLGFLLLVADFVTVAVVGG